MAAPTGAFTSVSAVGQREDLTDIIYDISPMDTPFLSSIGRTKAMAVLHEWQTDSLAAASTTNAEVEGFDVTGASSTATSRVTNYCQIQSKDLVVSRTLRSVRTAGRADEFDYQTAKRGRELRRDMEKTALNNQGATATSDCARFMRGVPSWLDTNTSVANCGADATASTATRTDATAGNRRLTEALVRTVMEAVWNSGGEPTMLMVGPVNKGVISTDFCGRASSTVLVSRDRAQGSIDLYASDFGDLRVVPNRFQRDREALIIDPEMAAAAFIDGILREPLAKTGDSDKMMLVTEWTLEMRNEAAHGGVFDLLHCHS